MNSEKGKEQWQQVTTWLNTPPAVVRAPTASAVTVLPPSQHAAAFAAFAGFGGR